MTCATGMQLQRCDCTSSVAPGMQQNRDLLSDVSATANSQVRVTAQEQPPGCFASVSPFAEPAVTSYLML